MSVFVTGKEGEVGNAMKALSMEPDAVRNEISHLSTKSAKGCPMVGRLTVNVESFC